MARGRRECERKREGEIDGEKGREGRGRAAEIK